MAAVILSLGKNISRGGASNLRFATQREEELLNSAFRWCGRKYDWLDDNKGKKGFYERMSINIELYCPRCHNSTIVRNGKKCNGPQNYLCKGCGKQFISDSQRTYKGTLSWIHAMIQIMLVRGCGIRDTSAILGISTKKVLNVLVQGVYKIQPQKRHYNCLEVDEFWTYVGSKSSKVWLIYAYHRETGEIVAYVWGKRDLKTAQKLRKRLKRLGITYDAIACDQWDSFLAAFGAEAKHIGKRYTVGIEGNNCRLRHRIRRVFRRTCCFSKKLKNHMKAFAMSFFYINYGYV
jgi:IS1 family transposase/transposase-like protein